MNGILFVSLGLLSKLAGPNGENELDVALAADSLFRSNPGLHTIEFSRDGGLSPYLVERVIAGVVKLSCGTSDSRYDFRSEHASA